MGRPASDRAKDKPRRKTREEGRKEVGVGSQYPDFFRNRDCSKIVRRKPQGGIRRSTGVSRLRPEGPWEVRLKVRTNSEVKVLIGQKHWSVRSGRQLRRRETGWRAAGSERPVHKQNDDELDSA